MVEIHYSLAISMEFPIIWMVRPRLPVLCVVYLTTIYLLVNLVEGQIYGSGFLEIGELDDVNDLKYYLERFGYIQSYNSNPEQIRDGLESLQEFANIEVTGIIDEATKELMKTPRCENKDPIKFLDTTTRKRRYNAEGTTWKKNILTWRYNNETKDLDRETVQRTIKAAMKKWSDVTNIEFRESTEKEVDIDIDFPSTSTR